MHWHDRPVLSSPWHAYSTESLLERPWLHLSSTRNRLISRVKRLLSLLQDLILLLARRLIGIFRARRSSLLVLSVRLLSDGLSETASALLSLRSIGGPLRLDLALGLAVTGFRGRRAQVRGVLRVSFGGGGVSLTEE